MSMTLEQRVEAILNNPNLSDRFKEIFLLNWRNSSQDLQAFNRAVAIAETKTGEVVFTVVINQVSVANTAQEDQGPGTQSAGTEVAAAQAARSNNASTTNPPPTVVVPAPVNTNATPYAPSTDAGTDEPTRYSVDTQATPPNTAAPSYPPPSSLPGPNNYPPQDYPNEYYLGYPAAGPDAGQGTPASAPPGEEYDYTFGVVTSQDPGASAASDDGTTAGIVDAGAEDPYGLGGGTNSTTQTGGVTSPGSNTSNEITTLVNKTARPITPRSNILDQYSSYTYSVSLYLMSPEDYSRLLTTKKRYIPGYQLLMQSGGAAQFSAGYSGVPNDLEPGGASLAQGRNQFFPLDYYIDDVEIKTLLSGKGTGGAHNAVDLKFKIIEPNGITLLDNLYKATRQYIEQGGGAGTSTSNKNYAAQNYLMVIRFYGYDENGNLITNPGVRDTSGKTDSAAIVEKFIPFQFTGIKFKIANRLTEYDCTGVCPQNVIGSGQGRGVIPFNIELSATTLQNLLNGTAQFKQTTTVADDGREVTGSIATPDKANTAPNPTLTTGLAQALNKYQSELQNEGTYGLGDVYKFVISHPELANASIVPQGEIDRKSKPMIQATSAAQANDGDKQSVNNKAKTVSATAGMSIVQFLDLVARSSDYIYKQQNKIIDTNGDEIPQGTSAQAFAWYRIGIQAKPIGSDPKRNDDAYEITYELAPYGVNDIKSEYFPRGRFRGSQKKYAYWFTGQNSSVLNFEQDFNYLYYITVNSRQKRPTTKGTIDYREVEKRLFAPNSPQTNQGVDSWYTNEPSANAADYLYSPSDQSRAKLTIIGDPAWIAQGEVWSGIRSSKKTYNNDADVYFDAFLNDGTINFDAREALFEIEFNKPVDYNLDTGLMNPNAPGVTTQNYVYKAIQAVSVFKQGKFTQELEGVLLIFPDSISKTTQIVKNGFENTTTDNVFSTGPTQADAATARQQQTDAPNLSLDITGRIGTGALGSGVYYDDPLGGVYSNSTNTQATAYNPVLLAETTNNPTGQDASATTYFDGFEQPLYPSDNAPPTSGGQPIGGNGINNIIVNTNGQDGSINTANNNDTNNIGANFLPPNESVTVIAGPNFVDIQPVQVAVKTIQGDVITVSTESEAAELYGLGVISMPEYNRAVVVINALQAAQQPQLGTTTQLLRKDD